MRLNAAYDVLPKTRTAMAAVVMDHFGIGLESGRHVVADGLELPIRQGQVVLFTGPSGSGKSSLLRAAAAQLDGVLFLDGLDLGDRLVVDSLEGPSSAVLPILTACGLGEGRLMLRKPSELSDGERCRLRLAVGVARQPAWLAADEFAAVLDRTLAKAAAYNVRRLADRTGIGFLLATAHDDLVDDLDPDLHVQCGGDGVVVRERTEGLKKKRAVSFAPALWISEGTRADWPYFARWHYRGSRLGPVRRVTVLWHGAEAVGICVFAAPAAALRARRVYFGLSGRWSRVRLQAWNAQLVNLSRVVLDPRYRGCGLATAFVRRSCETCRWPWIETLAEMGHLHPFFERAGFERVAPGAGRRRAARSKGSREQHSEIYGARKHGRGKRLLSAEAHEKSRHAEPVYYVFDNRPGVRAG